MATLETLMAIVGQRVASDGVRSLIAEDRPLESIDFDLGEGKLQRTFLANRAGGYQLSHQRDRVDLAIVYARRDRGFESFGGPLPGGVPLGATRDDVHLQLGMPSRRGVSDQGPWDGYLVGPSWVYFCYDAASERVRWATIEPAVTIPNA
jgi:hypothetical protein